ncbi:MAG: class I SAM-dependent methyltransferase [Firmicutes bacterium]|nr:class I SAM-dependent methyltransferase [Bacillota bacterium]
MIENKTMIYLFVGIGILLILEGIICFFGADFDVVTTINTVYFWSDTIKGLSEIYRVLKPGKSFYNVLFTKEYLDTIKYTQIGYKKFEPEELIVAGKQVGFHTVSIREISKGKSFIVIYKK